MRLRMASTRIREAKESDCGDIMRMIRVKTAGGGGAVPGAPGAAWLEWGEWEMRVYLWILFLEHQGLPALVLSWYSHYRNWQSSRNCPIR